VPNFWNVFSNAPFIIFGLYGIYITTKFSYNRDYEAKAYLIHFIFIAIIALGSGYYHWNPNNDTLIWDRLPMTVAFTSIFAIICSERISRTTGEVSLYPLTIIGALSVIYWAIYDDLRFYYIVQFLPLIIYPAIIVIFPSRYTDANQQIFALIWYAVAKVLETYDVQIYNGTNHGISGHSLKHVAAAISSLHFAHMLMKRKIVRSVSSLQLFGKED